MIRNKFGFSFVEIIVVVAILSIISGISITHINLNFEKQNIYSQINTLSNTIQTLEQSLGTEFTDYELHFLTGSKFFYYTNKNYKSLHQSLALSGNTGTVNTNDTMKNNLDVILYWNDKKINTSSFSSTGSFLVPMDGIGTYKIRTQYQEYELNDIHIHSFQLFDTKKEIVLHTIQDGSGNTYSGVKITNNIGQTKGFYSHTGTKINNFLVLHFESNGIPIEYIIK